MAFDADREAYLQRLGADELLEELRAIDHVLPHITPSIGFEPSPTPTALADYLASLARVRSLPTTLVLPAHGPVFDDLAGRVDELLAHHEVLVAQGRAARERGRYLALVGGSS